MLSFRAEDTERNAYHMPRIKKSQTSLSQQYVFLIAFLLLITGLVALAVRDSSNNKSNPKTETGVTAQILPSVEAGTN
jgi:hypothetical protein